MKVKLIALTQSMVEGVNTPEELIVYTARVSNPSNQLNTMTAYKLISFLIRKNHWSPFEQADMTVEVVTSRAIAAQILRHWSMRFQEFSLRYAEAVEMEPIELRRGNTDDRQSSSEVFDPILGAGEEWATPASKVIEQCLQSNVALYKDLLAVGVAKECARMILPLTTQTTLYIKGNIRSWIFYLMQRTDAHAQLEHRMVANEIEIIFAKHFPNIFDAVKALREKPAVLLSQLEILLENMASNSHPNDVEDLTKIIEGLKKG